jgi:hypothetical protein
MRRCRAKGGTRLSAAFRNPQSARQTKRRSKRKRLPRNRCLAGQTLNRAAGLTVRYVANTSHCWATADSSLRAAGTGRPARMLRGQLFGPGGNTTPEYWIKGGRLGAAAKAPQRKRPCRSRATSRRSLIRHACFKHQRASAESVRCGRKSCCSLK